MNGGDFVHNINKTIPAAKVSACNALYLLL